MENFHIRMRAWAFLLLALVATATTWADSRPVTLYGYLYYSDAWSDSGRPVPYYGFYHITTGDGSNALQGCEGSVSSDQVVSNSGCYWDGKYYAMDILGSYRNYQSYLRVFDVKDGWKQVQTFDLGTKQEETVASDMTYEPIEGKIWAATRPFGNTEQGWLATVDPTTGKFTRLCSSRFYAVLAADSKGQLWGISREGDLYRVEKDGTDTKIGNTGYVPNDLAQGGTIDFRTNTLYWAWKGFLAKDTWRENCYSQILAIDLSTAKATKVVEFSRQEQLTALGIINAHPAAPDDLSDLACTPTTPGAKTANVTFTTPAVTYGQEPMTGTVDVQIYLDGTAAASHQAQAGQPFSAPVEFAEYGEHTVSVVLSKDGRQGVEQTVKVFTGSDNPAPVTDLRLTVSADRSTATLTWTAPTAGENGGYLDPSQVRYIISREPKGEDVVTDYATSDGTWSEVVPTDMENIAYSVVVKVGDKESRSVKSNWETAGQPIQLGEFLDVFGSQHNFDAYTVIDANGDADDMADDFYKPQWKWDEQYGCAFYYTSILDKKADDWLISPAFKFEAGKVYRLSFQAWGYYGYENNLAVTIGNDYTVAGQTRVLSDRPFAAPMGSPVVYHIDFIPEATDRYIGWHVTTEAGEHTSIDNLYLRPIATTDVPARPSNATAQAINNDEQVKISFTLPTKTEAGDPINEDLVAYIYRAGEESPAFAETDLSTGAEVTWTDTQAKQSLNEYTIYIENEAGKSIGLTLTCDLTQGIPGVISSLAAARNEDGTVTLFWQRPAAGTDGNGHTIRPEKVLYRIQRITDGVYTTIADSVRTINYTDENPAADMLGLQGVVNYSITPFSTGGEGGTTFSNSVIAGASYPLPFQETWEFQNAKTAPWRTEGETGSWSVVGTGYDPYTLGQDGPGLVNFSGDDLYGRAAYGIFLSPYIDLSRGENPTLSFYLYTHPSYDADTKLMVGYEDGLTGRRQAFPTTYLCQSTTEGWQQYTIDLSTLQGKTDVAIYFIGSIKKAEGNTIHLDNVQINADNTGIHNVSTSSANAPLYDLSGRRVLQPQRGQIYIQGGKTVLK